MATLIAVDDYINIDGLGNCAIANILPASTLEVRQVKTGKYFLVSGLDVLVRYPDTVYTTNKIVG
tara:strand:+ start:290 stop:484 length:195 start_codon:yes stop_codon:yes gene_type:complete